MICRIWCFLTATWFLHFFLNIEIRLENLGRIFCKKGLNSKAVKSLNSVCFDFHFFTFKFKTVCCFAALVYSCSFFFLIFFYIEVFRTQKTLFQKTPKFNQSKTCKIKDAHSLSLPNLHSSEGFHFLIQI